ncbi:hypothetical protein VTL71DRAFT_2693 [Oculimacula yallundae]|uniref:FAD-binding FR-type domain-containing protein n=1 Tax=Oculimacula yallundae TaxID=86028 RepID=A0ABR4C9J7_9HELO
MILLCFVLISALLALSVGANAIDCLEGIVAATGQFIFNATDAYYNNLCHGELFLTSVYAAAKTYCTPEEIIAGSASVGKQCVKFGFTFLTPYEEFAPNLTDAFISTLPVVGYEDIAVNPMRNTSVIVSKSLFKTGADTFSVFKMSLVIDARYGWGVYGFWGGVLLIGIVIRIFKFLIHKPQPDRPLDAAALESRSSPTSYTTAQRIWGWAQAKFILPPLIGTYHRRLLGTFTIPTRTQSFVVLAYWAWSIIICAVSYDIFSPNLYYTKEVQAWRYIADRTGVMSYANLPVMWMFSGRNNVFLWATGWEFSTFNLFHRHVARIATLQAFIHSLGWTVIELKGGKARYAKDWKQRYWYMGGLAMVTMGLIIGSSTIILRRKFYEVFLVLHIVLSITTIVGLFFHTKILVGQYEPYLWPLVAIWCFDRFVRIIRQVNCNLRVKSGKLSTTTSTVEYVEEANLLILSVVLGTSSLKPKPNQHYFLYQPFKWRGWENHPFTAASWTNVLDENLSSSSSQSSVSPSPHSSTKEDNEITVAPLSAPSQNSTPKVTGRVKLTFYVRPSTPSSSSFTNQLRKMCLASNSRSPVPTRLLLEGPYGSYESLNHYDNILFITGGTGISAALPYLKSFLQPNATSQRPTNVQFIWTTKQARMVQEIFNRELATLPTSHNVQVKTFITGTDRTAASSITRSSDDDEKPVPKDIMSLGIRYGRPDLKSLIDSMAEEKGKESMAVFVCGPAGMADQARVAVTGCLNRGLRRMDLIEEVFGW